MGDYFMFYLVQWEDRMMSVLTLKDIVSPKKSGEYMEGDYIMAVFQKKTYGAVISEIHPNKKYLLQQAKLPPKHHYDVNMQRKIRSLSDLQLTQAQKTKTQTQAQWTLTPKETRPLREMQKAPPHTESQETSGTVGRENENSGLSHQQQTQAQRTLTPKETRPLREVQEALPRTESQETSGTVGIVKENSALQTSSPPVAAKRNLTSSEDRSDDHDLKEECRSLRRKIRRLEDRVAALESSGTKASTSDSDSQFEKLVQHFGDGDVQKVLTTLVNAVFTAEELINCSRTGKKTVKCEGQPRPPLDPVKLAQVERLVMTKTKMSRDLFYKKFENLQKTLRQKQQK